MRRGSNINPANRFESIRHELDLEQVELHDEFLESFDHRPIEYLDDQSQSIISSNNSPDLPFNYSLNPYRGCVHGCAYCYARPTHEYLGFNAGLDFETKIVVKKNAAELFRKFLSRPKWKPEPISFSGVTDCYQPAEREFRLTRQCLEVALEFRQPVSIVTKNGLVARDIDILKPMAELDLIHACVSLTTLDNELARDMEPRTTTPAGRLKAIRKLSEHGIPVGAMIAPIIPGLNDSEVPALLAASADAGATVAGFVLLRLPLTVQEVFQDWVRRVRPDQAEMILGRVRQIRGGDLNVSAFVERMSGSGLIADQISQMFSVYRDKVGLKSKFPQHNCDDFTIPNRTSDQLRLF